MDDYEQKAQDFLKATGTEFKAEFVENRIYFDDDKEPRDVYKITLTRGTRSFSFMFGNSLNNSIKFRIIQGYITNEIRAKLEEKKINPFGINTKEEFNKIKGLFYGQGKFWEENKNFEEPTAYDFLACVQKYEPTTFKDFCSEFGYNTDSRRAEKIFKAVQEEYDKIAKLYNDKEIEQLQEIA